MVGSVQALVPERFGSAPPESRGGLRQAIGPLAPLLLLCRLAWRSCSVRASLFCGLDAADGLAGLDDFTRPFVAGCHRIVDWDDVLAAIEFVVRMADADRAQAHEDLAGLSARERPGSYINELADVGLSRGGSSMQAYGIVRR